MNRFIIVLLSISLAGCSSVQHASKANHLNSKEYQSRKELTQSLFGDNKNSLSEDTIKKILNSKIKIPSQGRLGIIKIEQTANFSTSFHWLPSDLLDNKTFVLNEELAKNFFGRIESSGRVKDITILPSMMIPKPLSIDSLRESAVRLQVDMLLVLRTESIGDFKFRPFWLKNKAKSVTTVEAILLDTKTGVIPYTAITTASIFSEESWDDLTRAEVMKRSTEKAETEALSKLASNLASFLKEAP